MTSLKRIALLLVIGVVVVCLSVFLATTFSENQPAASSNLKIKVLRRKDQSHVKPTKAEVAIAKAQAKEERTLEDKIPKHLPIKVKIKADKEKEFKDVDNPQWAHNLELEVTNTGTKPIYFFVLLVRLPEPEIREGKIVFPIRYGRTDFSMFQDVLERAKPEDVPIKPGESFTFKVNYGNLRAFERFQAKLGWPNPKKLIVEHQEMSFGDGTGFRWVEGAPWPPVNKKISFNEGQPKTSRRTTTAHHAPAKKTSSIPDTKTETGPPNFVSFAPLNELKGFATVTSRVAPDCCPSGCQWVREYNSQTACYGIGCDSIHRVDVLPCSNAGKCRKVEWEYQTCVVHTPDPNNDYEHECPIARTSDCSSSTPTPTPTPPPQPPPGSGLGGGSGNEGGTPYPCTEYFWYWFVSYDGGNSWELVGADYAGCW
jgi:hypothetical protein